MTTSPVVDIRSPQKKPSKKVKKMKPIHSQNVVRHEFLWLPDHSPHDSYAGLVFALRNFPARCMVVLPSSDVSVKVQRLLVWAQVPFILCPSEDLNKDLAKRGIDYVHQAKSAKYQADPSDHTTILCHNFKSLTSFDLYNVERVIQFDVLNEGKQYAQLNKIVRCSTNCPSVTLTTLANKKVQLDMVKLMGRSVKAAQPDAPFGHRMVTPGILENLKEDILKNVDFKKKGVPLVINKAKVTDQTGDDFFDGLYRIPSAERRLSERGRVKRRRRPKRMRMKSLAMTVRMTRLTERGRGEKEGR